MKLVTISENLQYAQSEQANLIIWKEKIIASSNTELFPFNTAPKFTSKEFVTLEDLGSRWKFMASLGLTKDDLILEEDLKYCTVYHNVFECTFSVKPKLLNRFDFFKGIGREDPFRDFWITSQKKPKLTVDDSFLTRVEDFYSYNPETKIYQEAWEQGNCDHCGGGAHRGVQKSDELGVVFKYIKAGCSDQQQKTEALFSLKSTHPLFPPLLSAFGSSRGTILVFPRLFPKDNDSVQKSSETRMTFLRKLAGSNSFAFLDRKALMTYESVCMYAGSQPWFYYKDLPVFYDLGECLTETILFLNDEKTTPFDLFDPQRGPSEVKQMNLF